MNTYVSVACLLALVAACQGYGLSAPIITAPILAPAAVSTANMVKASPIPYIRTIAAPIIKTVATPIITAPVIRTVVASPIGLSPIGLGLGGHGLGLAGHGLGLAGHGLGLAGHGLSPLGVYGSSLGWGKV